LEEPLKLPALKIDLPLYWFFVLAPIRFVLFHLYVLLQVLLLSTAVVYNDAVNRTVKSLATEQVLPQATSPSSQRSGIGIFCSLRR